MEWFWCKYKQYVQGSTRIKEHIQNATCEVPISLDMYSLHDWVLHYLALNPDSLDGVCYMVWGKVYGFSGTKLSSFMREYVAKFLTNIASTTLMMKNTLLNLRHGQLLIKTGHIFPPKIEKQSRKVKLKIINKDTSPSDHFCQVC